MFFHMISYIGTVVVLGLINLAKPNKHWSHCCAINFKGYDFDIICVIWTLRK